MRRVKSLKGRPPVRTNRMRVIRTVASSTAIETGEPVASIEARLKSRKSPRFKHLKLA